MVNFLKIGHSYRRKKPMYIGNVELSGNCFKTMDEVYKFRDSMPDKSIFTGFEHKSDYGENFNMLRIEFLHELPNTPDIIMSVWRKMHHLYNASNLVGIIGKPNSVGLTWHKDPVMVVAMNIIGNTVWEINYKNRIIKIPLGPGDILSCPPHIGHQVKGDGERFTLAFCFTEHDWEKCRSK